MTASAWQRLHDSIGFVIWEYICSKMHMVMFPDSNTLNTTFYCKCKQSQWKAQLSDTSPEQEKLLSRSASDWLTQLTFRTCIRKKSYTVHMLSTPLRSYSGSASSALESPQRKPRLTAIQTITHCKAKERKSHTLTHNFLLDHIQLWL